MVFSGDFLLKEISIQQKMWKLHNWVKIQIYKNIYPTTSLVQTREIGVVELMYKRLGS